MRADRRAAVVSLVALVIAVVAMVASLTMGDYPLPISDVLTVLTGGDGSTRRSAYVILELRLPRALAAIAVGAAFGLSGAIVQRVVRNPLASPDIIGINAGAGAAAVFLVVIVAAGPVTVASGALTGALATAVGIYLLSWRRGVTGYRLVLVGIGITAMLTSVTAYLLNTANVYTAEQAAIWLSGSLAGRSWGHVLPVLLAVAVLLPVALRLAASLRALELGDDLALALGTRAEPARVALLATAVALAAVATAAAGPIAFVALAAPQLARRLVRERGLALVTSAAVGAALLACADLAARRVLAPAELPVGVLTTVLGAPLLIWLLARANRIGRTG
ncbi:FecCD family ABC transporter permease [Micromonospora olivasterospora]|uniref:Iron complex transport system permease protein n=1 Tax=Micromonospora olivasterospora TaxID=1880 RepID=A0A562I840_MICOL|nr:iron chelate uptake ABC transporter family permease subunit [Micromonospora olivasterospora]TWH67187.1 iron complex transport system permease protein [Micromonospora olivasterospora]